MPRLNGLLVSALVAFGVLFSGCRGTHSPSESFGFRHVLFVTVDTLRADHLGFYGYERETSPNLDRRAAEGVVFETAIAQWPKTGASFAATFTGKYPLTTGLTHYAAIEMPEEHLTLPQLFRRQGFTTLAVVSNAVLSAELGWDRGFIEYLETWAGGGDDRDDPFAFRRWINAPRVNEVAKPLLERYRDEERLFVWLHYSDPHGPYLLPAGEENPFLGDALYVGNEQVELDRYKSRGTRLGNRYDLKYYVAQYDANIRVVDGAIEAMLEWAEELGILEESLVVFSADHGESLGEHGYFFGHGRLPFNNAARVPLLLFGPGIEGGRRVDAPVELLDLYPTMADLFAPEETVADIEGDSLVPWLVTPERADLQDRFRIAFGEAGGPRPLTHYRTAQDGRWKLVYHPRRWHLDEKWELYDLESDPGETDDRLADGPPELRLLKRELDDWMNGRLWIAPPRKGKPERSIQTKRALRALGYIQ